MRKSFRFASVTSVRNLIPAFGCIGVLLFSAVVQGADSYISMYVKQALVHSILPERPRRGVSVIMVPGHNLSSYIYVTTPDGREGWAQRFAENGYEVHVINDPNFDFSRGFHPEPFFAPTEGAPPADPSAAQGWSRDVWMRRGFGGSEGEPFPDTRFPTDHFGEFQAGYPYVSNAGRSYSESIVALLKMVGPAILMAHSAGGRRC